MKHTPGPWELVLVEKWPFGIRVKAGGKDLISQAAYANSSTQNTRWDCENAVGFRRYDRAAAKAAIAEQDANARLIAAAPELLEACKHMLDFCPPGLMPDLKSAIAKAEGVDPENGTESSHKTMPEAKTD